MNYTKREVVRRLKQYDMFVDSLSLITDPTQKERICDQLDKIEKQILLETNSEYEEEYMLLLGKETKYFEEEKARLRDLISLIIERRSYLENRKAKHKKITGSLVELTTFLGEDKLSEFKKRLRIIEKYEENKEKQEALIKEIKSLDIKISEASRNVKSNMRLNDSLENKMMTLVDDALKSLSLYDLIKDSSTIEEKYTTTKYALSLAKDNLASAKDLDDRELIFDCDNQLSEITREFNKYNEKVYTIRLAQIFDKKVEGYDELLDKRTKMFDILKELVGSALYQKINDELNKQYNTIKLEKEDIKSYEALKSTREEKNKALYEIEEENNSREFKLVLEDLIRNEKKYHEEKIQQARKKEYQERQKRLAEEQKLELSRVKRQKLIEEAKLKEQSEKISQLKSLQDNTVITQKESPSKREDKPNVVKDDFLSSDFNTNELFENTKIVPNQKEESLLKKEEENINTEIFNPKEETKEKDTFINQSTLFDENKKSVIDLFKEEQKKASPVEVKNESTIDDKAPTSIYDVLENNKNIIWKNTDTNTSKDTIPVIDNNNFKPIIKEEKKIDNNFPSLGSEEGVLWKETL